MGVGWGGCDVQSGWLPHRTPGHTWALTYALKHFISSLSLGFPFSQGSWREGLRAGGLEQRWARAGSPLICLAGPVSPPGGPRRMGAGASRGLQGQAPQASGGFCFSWLL